ncbi:hypothetical protein Daus18300_010972 [Diaporthe australafricana]|uniref:DUF7918 domain-containing protein n=1 Tax=Diaporthe australafricana TaxID=127596 RepID=A0ABR3W8H7_9PEZI
MANSPLKEYEDEKVGPADRSFGDETRKCRRYVEVVKDANFAIQLHVSPTINCLNNPEQGIEFALDLDGHNSLTQAVLVPSNSMVIKGAYESDGQTTMLRNFKFATVSTVEEEDGERVAKDRETAELLGLICVRVWRSEPIEDDVPMGPIQADVFDDVDGQLAEKALNGKALSHRAILSAPVETREISLTVTTLVDPLEAPLAVFYFKYRLRGLQSLNPVQGGNPAIKREQSETQVSERPRKVVKISGGREAIDLTDDD